MERVSCVMFLTKMWTEPNLMHLTVGDILQANEHSWMEGCHKMWEQYLHINKRNKHNVCMSGTPPTLYLTIQPCFHSWILHFLWLAARLLHWWVRAGHLVAVRGLSWLTTTRQPTLVNRFVKSIMSPVCVCVCAQLCVSTTVKKREVSYILYKARSTTAAPSCSTISGVALALQREDSR